jgi:hypothetical protein
MLGEIQMLKDWWAGDWMKLHKAVSNALLHGHPLAKLDCPKTPPGLIDLRGYSAPKDIKRVKSRKGNWNSFVHESISIKKQHFEGVDLSYSDLRLAVFLKVHSSPPLSVALNQLIPAIGSL